jgi:hypothetical protein
MKRKLKKKIDILQIGDKFTGFQHGFPKRTGIVSNTNLWKISVVKLSKIDYFNLSEGYYRT